MSGDAQQQAQDNFDEATRILKDLKNVLMVVYNIDDVFQMPIVAFFESFNTRVDGQLAILRDTSAKELVTELEKLESSKGIDGKGIKAVREGWNQAKRSNFHAWHDEAKAAIDTFTDWAGRNGTRLITGDTAMKAAGTPSVVPGFTPVLAPGTLTAEAVSVSEVGNVLATMIDKLKSLAGDLYGERDNTLVAELTKANNVPANTSGTVGNWVATNVSNVLEAARRKLMNNDVRRLQDFFRSKTFDEYLDLFGTSEGSGGTVSSLITIDTFKGMHYGLPPSTARQYTDRSTTLWTPFFQDALSNTLLTSSRLVTAEIERKALSDQLGSDARKLEAAVIKTSPISVGSVNYNPTRYGRFNCDELKRQIDSILMHFSRMSSDNVSLIAGTMGLRSVFFRIPSAARMRYYTMSIQRFRDRIKSAGASEKPWLAEMQSIVERVKKEIALVDQDNVEVLKSGTEYQDQTYAAFVMAQAHKKRAAHLIHAYGNATACIQKYVHLHRNFATKEHRQAMRYMLYWATATTNSAPIPAAAQELRDWRAARDEISALGAAEVDALLVAAQAGLVGVDTAAMSREDAQRVENARLALLAAVEKARDRVASYYERPLNSRDLLQDTQVLLLYLLKLARLGAALLALHLATRVFLPMYTSAVYDKNLEPPHPALYVAIFAGIDAAFTVLMLLVLALVRYMFCPPGTDFIVNDFIVARFALDAVVGSSLTLVLALLIAVVVRSRKYFRYRFEGERGIRALEVMLRYVCGAMLALPFYRIAD
jgi:hypothetical protein